MDTNTNKGISPLSIPSVSRWLIASSMLLTGACDEGLTDQGSALDHSELRSATVGTPIVTGMGAGNGRSWALLDDGTTKGWGEPYCSPSGCLAPDQIAPLELGAAALEVHSYDDRTIARLADGTVVTWTTSVSNPTPVALGASEPVAQLAMGEDFMCARFESGIVHCQGLDNSSAPASIVRPLRDGGPDHDRAIGAGLACRGGSRA